VKCTAGAANTTESDQRHSHSMHKVNESIYDVIRGDLAF
jgi:hypothetical protein